MPPVFIPSKLQLPTLRSGLILRPRLYQRLTAGLKGKLTLISASTGFGKTTLANAWVQKCGLPVAWLTLDELDNDPLRFLTYLVRAAQTIQPRFGAALLETLTAANPQDFDPVPARFLEALVAEIAAIQTTFLLVLDDYHLITRLAIQAVPQFLLNHQPANLHLILISRADPPWPLGRLRARREINEIRSPDLRFTLAETTQYLNEQMGLRFTPQQVSDLEARTEGWIAGLQLAALSLQGDDNPQATIANLAGSHRYIADYLIEEVLEKQTPEIQEFLFQTSVLEPLNAALCDAVTGRSDSQLILRQLEQANLFLQPLDQERNWYRYHHLFADLLKIKLRQALPGQTTELQRRACHWHDHQGQRLEALRYALDAGDAQLAERLLAGNIFQLLNHDEAGAALHKLESMPLASHNAQPWLGITRAYLLSNTQWDKANQILEDIASHLKTLPASPETSRLEGHVEAAWCYLYSVQGDVEKTVYHAERAESLLPHDEVEIRAMSLALWGDILSKNDYDPNAMPILERALALALQAEKPYAATLVTVALALAHMGAGHLSAAHQFCQQALSIAADYQRHTGQELSAAAMNYAVLARIYSEWNQPKEALACGFKGLELSERLGDKGAEVMCRQYLGYSLLVSGDLVQGRQVFQRTREIAQAISPWAELNTVHVLVDCLLDRENAQDPELQDALRFFEQAHVAYPPWMEVRLLLKTGQPQAARSAADKFLNASHGSLTNQMIRVTIFRSLALQALGDEAAALAALTPALIASESENRQLAFLREGPPMEKLLRRAERQGVCPVFTARLLTAFAQRTANQPPSVIKTGLEPLSERELEILRLLAANLDAPEIAAKLVVSVNTVRTHIKSLYRKLNVHSRHEALLRAGELKLT